jgi:hypothetical protein
MSASSAGSQCRVDPGYNYRRLWETFAARTLAV